MTDSSISDVLNTVVEEAQQPEPSQQAEVKPEPLVEPEEVKQEAKEEVFADKGELKGKTPEELEATYDTWQKAYAAKRQKETAELREMRDRLAEMESRLSQAPKEPATTQDKVDAAAKQVELGQMTMPEYTEYVRKLLAEDARRIAREEITNVTSEQQEQQYQEQAVTAFRKADPRLDDKSPEYNEGYADDIRRELADKLDEHLESTGTYKGFDTETIAKQIVARRDAEIDEIIKKRTQQSTQAAKMREAKNRKSEVRGTTSDSQKIGGDSIKDILSDTVDSLG